MSAPSDRPLLAPMPNERLFGHALAIGSTLLAVMVVWPDGQESGTTFALVALLALLATVLWNAAAIGLRSATHGVRWALVNAGLLAVAFTGALGALDAGYAFSLQVTPHLWVQLFVALMGGSVMVPRDRALSH